MTVQVRIIHLSRADDAVTLSRVPCIGECIQYRSAYPGRWQYVKVETVCHYSEEPFAAQVTVVDVS